MTMQSVLGGMRLRSPGVELNGNPIDGRYLYEFCVCAVLAPERPC